jgi:hypothetical protein
MAQQSLNNFSSQPPSLCASYVLTLADVDALSTLLEKQNTRWLDVFIRWFFPIVACFGAFFSIINFWSGSAHYNSWMGRYGDVVFWVSLALSIPVFMALRPFLFRLHPHFGVQEQVCLEENGVRTHTREEGFLTWNYILRVEEVETHCFLFLDKKGALIVPKRAFESPETAQKFIAFAQNHWREANLPYGAPTAPPQ